MNANNLHWTEIANYPYRDSICRMAILNHRGYFYIFGGLVGTSKKVATIARLDRYFEWSNIGDLSQARRGIGFQRLLSEDIYYM